MNVRVSGCRLSVCPVVAGMGDPDEDEQKRMDEWTIKYTQQNNLHQYIRVIGVP